MKKIVTAMASFALVLVLCSLVFAAAAPNLISYQGRLTDAGGTPITTPVALLFRIHTSQAATTDIWSETQVGVLPNAGLFNVNLGAVNPLTDAIFGGEERWLSVSIGSTEISRTRLTSVGYSQRVNTVDRARGGVISSSITIEESATKDADAAPPSLILAIPPDSAFISLTPITNKLNLLSPGDIRVPLKPGRHWLWEQVSGLTPPKIVIDPYAFSTTGFLSAVSGIGSDTIRFTSDPADGGGFTCGSTGGPIIIRPGSGRFDIRNLAGSMLWRMSADGEFRCGSTGPIRIRPSGIPRITLTDTAGVETFGFDDTGEIRCGSTGPIRIRPTKSKIFEILDTVGGPRYRFDDRRFVGFGAGGATDTIFRLDNGESYISGGLRLGLGSKLQATSGQFTGGLQVGFSSSTPETLRLAVGDLNFRLERDNFSSPRLAFDANDFLAYNRTSNTYSVVIGAASEMDVKSTGLSVANGINVGYTGAIADNRVQIGDSNCYFDNGQIANTPLLNMDAHDFMSFDRTLNQFGFTVASTERFRVTSSGVCYVGTIGACSDQRYKKNIKPLTSSLDKVLHLRGVSYDWRRNEFPDKGFAEGNQIGFIAQELKDIVPEVVQMESDGYYTVDYSRLTPLLVEAIKDLKSQIVAQDKLIAGLQTEVAQNGKLRTDVNSLQSKLVAIEQMLARSNNVSAVTTAAK